MRLFDQDPLAARNIARTKALDSITTSHAQRHIAARIHGTVVETGTDASLQNRLMVQPSLMT